MDTHVHQQNPLQASNNETTWLQCLSSAAMAPSAESSPQRQPKRQGSFNPESDDRASRRTRGEANASNSSTGGTSKCLPNVAIFSGVENAYASGGAYTVAGRDAHITIHNYSSCYTPSQPYAQETSSAVLFLQIHQSFEDLKRLLEPGSHPGGTCHAIFSDLCELRELLRVSSLAYQACDDRTLVGKIMTRAINTRVLQCKAVLMSVHTDILAFLHQALQPMPFSFRVVYQWCTGSQPKEIAEARLALSVEARAVGEWLCNLRLFYWAARLFRTQNSTFSWPALEEFIQWGPKLLREIHVERIVIMEPLKGEAFSIPICFAESFEDVHRIVRFACEGTASSRFIEARQYQLDESKTNRTVDQRRFRSFIQDGRVFEVTMLLQTSSLSATECPRCGVDNDQSKDDSWIRCVNCQTCFSSQVSKPVAKSWTPVHGQVSINDASNRSDDIRGVIDRDAQERFHEPKSEPLAREENNRETYGDHDGSVTSAGPLTLFRRMKMVQSIALRSHFELEGASLDEAIARHREALDLRTKGHPDRSSFLYNLAIALQSHHTLNGAAESLEEAIVHHREALSLRPKGHPYRSLSLYNLAIALQSHHTHNGAADSLEEAIVHYREALSLHPRGHPYHLASLCNLANALQSHSMLKSAVASLEEACVHHREALSLCPEGHSHRPASLYNLGNAFRARFMLTGALVSLEEAIVHYREALSVCPQGYSFRSSFLINLASALQSHFELMKEPRILQETLSLVEEALSILPPGHSYDSVLQSNLSELGLQWKSLQADNVMEV